MRPKLIRDLTEDSILTTSQQSPGSSWQATYVWVSNRLTLHLASLTSGSSSSHLFLLTFCLLLCRMMLLFRLLLQKSHRGSGHFRWKKLFSISSTKQRSSLSTLVSEIYRGKNDASKGLRVPCVRTKLGLSSKSEIQSEYLLLSKCIEAWIKFGCAYELKCSWIICHFLASPESDIMDNCISKLGSPNENKQRGYNLTLLPFLHPTVGWHTTTLQCHHA